MGKKDNKGRTEKGMRGRSVGEEEEKVGEKGKDEKREGERLREERGRRRKSRRREGWMDDGIRETEKEKAKVEEEGKVIERNREEGEDRRRW